ncbi:MAG TPA: hypothetical protein VK184_22965 [Nostocaceae cyanobacterium]|nr:hypothetical protein [Nostocaceae cyanobacterium]
MVNFYKGAVPNRHYTKLPNSLIRDTDISDSCFRLIAWITSHIEGFKVNFQGIKAQFGYGRDKLRSIIKEAEAANYLVRIQIRNALGQIDWQYHVFADTKECLEFKADLDTPPIPENQPIDGSTSDGLAVDGLAVTGLSGDGSTHPLYIENQFKEEQIQENQREKAPLAQTVTLETEPVKPDQEDPLTLINPEVINTQPVQTKNLALSSNAAAPLTLIETYRKLSSEGAKLSQMDLRTWANEEIGEAISLYRKSGWLFTGGNDINLDFAMFVASKNHKMGEKPTASLGFRVINNCEKDPKCWQMLAIWVYEWQQNKNGGQDVNIADLVKQQQELQRIQEATSKPFRL